VVTERLKSDHQRHQQHDARQDRHKERTVEHRSSQVKTLGVQLLLKHEVERILPREVLFRILTALALELPAYH